MKIYKTQAEVEKDIKDGVLAIEGNVKFECSISISASIQITAGNITAGNITAWNITADNILYYAFCCVYQSIICASITAKRTTHQEPICLEGTLTIKSKEDDDVEKAIELLESKGKIKDGKIIV